MEKWKGRINEIQKESEKDKRKAVDLTQDMKNFQIVPTYVRSQKEIEAEIRGKIIISENRPYVPLEQEANKTGIAKKCTYTAYEKNLLEDEMYRAAGKWKLRAMTRKTEKENAN